MSQDSASRHSPLLPHDVDHVRRKAENSLLESALARFAEHQDAGQVPDLEDFVAGYPTCADELRECLHQLELLGGLAQVIQAERGHSLQSLPYPRLGKYRLIREIGRGGMGIVYEAIEVPGDHRVAVKVLTSTAAFDPKAVLRFRNEINAVSMLDHPNIVNVIGAGCHEGIDFYAMRFIEGQTLALILLSLRVQAKTGGFRPPATLAELASVGKIAADPSTDLIIRATKANPADHDPTKHQRRNGCTELGLCYFRIIAELAVEALNGLEHAHQQGVLHRDIKPSNLMLDESGHLWISDFGLARIERSTTLTETGDLIGTLRYMSPELLTTRHSAVDHRSDIYSLGAAIYEAMTLSPVVAGTDRADVIRQITRHKPVPLRGLVPQIPADLETIVMKALAREKEDRYSSCAEMAVDLRQFLTNRPIVARRPGLALKLVRWAQRNPVPAVAGFVSMVSLFIIGLLALWWVSFSREQAMTEKTQRLVQEQAARSAQESLSLHRHVADTIVAAQAWRNGDYGFLDEQMRKPEMAGDDFQLRLLREISAERPQVLATEDGGVYCVRVSPDGLQLATAGETGVSIRDRGTGHLLHHIRHHEGDTNSVAWSSNGTRLVTTGDDGVLNVYATSDWSRQFSCQVTGAVVMAAFLESTNRIAFCERVLDRNKVTCGDNALHIADASDGTIVWTDSSFSERPEGLAVTPDEKFMAVVDDDSLLHIYDLQTLQKQNQFRLHGALGQGFQGSCVAFAMTQPLVVAGCRGEVIRVFNHQTGELVQELPDSHAVEGIRFSPDDEAIIAASRRGQLFMWEATDTGRFYLAGEFRCSQPVWTCDVLADGSIYTAGDEGRIEVVNRFLASDRRRIRFVTEETFKRPDFHSFVREAVAAGHGSRAHEYASRRTIPVDRNIGEEYHVTVMTPTHDGDHWAVGLNRVLGLFRESSAVVTKTKATSVENSAGFRAVEVSPNGEQIFAATNDALMLCELSSLSERRRIPVSAVRNIINLAASDDGRSLYLCHPGRPENVAPSPITVLSPMTLEPIPTPSREFMTRAFHHPHYTNDALRYMVSLPDEFFRTAPGIDLLAERVKYVAVSKDKKVLVLAHGRNMVHIHHNEMWQQPLVIHTGPEEIRALDVSPDGSLIAVGADERVRLFHAFTGREFYELRTYLLQLTCLSFSPDGHCLLAAGRGLPNLPEIVIWGKRSLGQ